MNQVGNEKRCSPPLSVSLNQLLVVILLIVLANLAYVADVHRTGLAGSKKAVAPSKPGKPHHLFTIYGKPDRLLKSPMAVYVGTEGKIYVASTGSHEIQVFHPDGEYAFSFGQKGTLPGSFTFPYGITADEKGRLYVAETGNGRIQQFSPEGQFMAITAGRGTAIKVEKPGPLFYQRGRLYIGDLIQQQVIVLQPDRAPLKLPASYPHGITVDEDGSIYVVEAGTSRITRFNQAGQRLSRIEQWHLKAGLSVLRGLARDGAGRLYLVDSMASTIVVFDQMGRYMFNFGLKGFEEGQFLFPTGIFIDQKDRIYVADWANNRVQVWGYN
ncbi:MAG TPA: 6-bladed beta-propeller [Bacillota bacterium]|nr:6-bladed beta-propeller [Bacillota bacterium]